MVLPSLCRLLPTYIIPPDLDLQQVNDQFLMDTFFSCGQLSNCELTSINCCHLKNKPLQLLIFVPGSRDGTHFHHDSVLPQVAPFPSNLIWQHEQPSPKDWCIWSQAFHLAFEPQLIIATPLGLGSWLCLPHQPTVHIPYDPAWDLLYQLGHHGVWQVFTKLPHALVTNSFMQYMYTRAATSVPPMAYCCLCIPRPIPNAPFSGF